MPMDEVPQRWGEESLLDTHAVLARLDAYDRGGAFSRSLAALWADAGDVVLCVTRRHWQRIVELPHNSGLSPQSKMQLVAAGVEEMTFKLTQPFNAAWMTRVTQLGRVIFHTDIPTYMVARGLSELAASIGEALRTRFDTNSEQLAQHVAAVQSPLHDRAGTPPRAVLSA